MFQTSLKGCVNHRNYNVPIDAMYVHTLWAGEVHKEILTRFLKYTSSIIPFHEKRSVIWKQKAQNISFLFLLSLLFSIYFFQKLAKLFATFAWDRQGDWTNRELTYVCFWKRKAQNISFLFLLSLLFQYISFDWPNCLQLLQNSCYPFTRLLPVAQSTYKVN